MISSLYILGFAIIACAYGQLSDSDALAHIFGSAPNKNNVKTPTQAAPNVRII